jgi:predicted anti-sigma-YlaC factor YlaD
MCERLEEYFVALLEGEPQPDFDKHLSECPKCRKGLQQLVQLHRKLKKSLRVGNGLPEVWPN